MTIKEVAKAANVSTATVSYVINGTKNVTEEKRQRVLEAIDRLGYQPNLIAKSLRVKNTRIIGVIVEDTMDFPVSTIINGISEYVEKYEYQILLSDLRLHDRLINQYDKIVQYKDKINAAISFQLFGARVDAVIYVSESDRDITGVINPIPKPLVIAYSTTKDPGGCYVTYDSKSVSAGVIQHLLECGHKNIAVITGLAHTSPVKMRMRGVQRAFDQAGLILDSRLVKYGDWEYASGYRSMRELLEQELRPTAVFAMNDLMAVGAINAIQDAGLSVPGDVSVIGFDNREIASYMRPKLSTVEIDLRGIGQTSAAMALELLQNKTLEERTRILPSKIIHRDTVKRL